MSEKTDVVVIGGGPGGYAAAIRARQLGLDVILVERERLGGVCLNWGCIPTKAILSDTAGYAWASRAAAAGLIDSLPNMDFAKVMHRSSDVVERIVGSLTEHVNASGVRIVNGTARPVDSSTVEVDTGLRISARHILLATGSRPWVPNIDGIDLPGVMGTREILGLDRLPQRLLIIGGGVIGQEFAAIFSALGSDVTVLEALDTILAGVDGDMARRYKSLLSGKGITVRTGVRVRSIEQTPDGLRAVYESRSKEHSADADVVLTATGRRPWVEGLNLDQAGIELDGGAVRVDEYLRTSVPEVYAVGDVVGKRMLAHLAAYQGEVAAENMAGRNRIAEDSLVPCAVFTLPQIAWVGLTEEEASERGKPYSTSMFSLSASGKAVAMGEPRGWVKLVSDSESGKLIGAHLIGPDVSEIIGELTLALKFGMTAKDLGDTIHPHPTISEAVREAGLGFLDGPIHATKRVRNFPK